MEGPSDRAALLVFRQRFAVNHTVPAPDRWTNGQLRKEIPASHKYLAGTDTQIAAMLGELWRIQKRAGCAHDALKAECA